jgi:hypothetical protein
LKCWGIPIGESTFGYGGNPVGPAPVAGITSAIDISVGELHACAVTADGRVSCWGYDGNGELGTDVVGGSSSSPIVVPGVSSALAVAAGRQYSCALVQGGSVYCWGGDFSQIPHNPVAQVAGVADVIQVGAQDYTAGVLLNSGSVQAWYGAATGTGVVSASGFGPWDEIAVGGVYAYGGSGGAICGRKGSTNVACWTGSVVVPVSF